MKTKFPSLAPLFSAALLALAFVHPGEAADQVVTDLRDNGGPNQLRAKLPACLNTGGGGAVKPRSSGAVTNIKGSNFHDNSSTSNSTATGYGGAMQVFDEPGVAITTSAFTNNSAYREGGAIFMTPNSTVLQESTTFTGNTAGSEGGALSVYGTLQATNCTFSSNHATFGGGGAITILDGASTTVDTTTFTGNTASASVGGGIYNSGTLSLTDVTLNQNTAFGGGAINNNLGNVTLTRVTLMGNSATGGAGGGVANGATLTATNCTFSSNSAAYRGGGIYNGEFSTVTLMNVTFSGNSAPASGGSNVKNAGTLTATNTILAQGGAGGNCSGTISGSFNLADDNTCGFLGVNDILLGPLAANGCPTKTHLPLPGSRSIDRGIDTGAPATDLGGINRPQLAGIDVGAVEVVPQIFESTDLSVRYDGWEGIIDPSVSGGALRWSNFTNDTVTYKFNATSIKWLTRKGPSMGKALVTIDGVNKGTFDLYRATGLNQQFLFSGLASAPHNIVIKVSGTKNANATGFFVPLDGFQVGSSTKVVQESALAVQYDKWIGNSQPAASGGSYRINSSVGTAEFNFGGTSINFVTARGPGYGKVNVFIDDQLVSPNLDLYAPTQQWQYKMGYAGLANGPHIIDIEPTHTKNASSKGYGVVLDAFEAFPAPVD